MSTEPPSMMKDSNKPQGTKRPIVPSEYDSRVSQYATKNGISKRDAYEEMISFMLDEEGNIKEDNVNR